MAESFLFSIAQSLIEKLASRAYEEASQVLGVYDTLQVLKQTLSYIKAVLLDAEQKQEQNHELKEWLRQIKHVFYDAQNVLDEFECETLRKQVIKTHGTTKAKVSHFDGQKFLLILDDVWNEDRIKWVELRDLIQVGAKGSKILMTTCSNSVASMMETVSSHILEGLSLDDSLSLFVK